MTSFYSEEELDNIGFSNIGKNVKVSRKASFYNPQVISIGDNVRIDDFCVLSAGEGISLGNYIHIAVYSSVIGKAPIIVEDYCNISSRVSIYSSNDDYSGEFMTNPTIDSEYTNVLNLPVVLKKHVIIGSGAVVLPGVTLEEGACVGALSLVNKDCGAFKMYAGIPAKYINDRSRNLLQIEKRMIQDLEGRSS
ncbi:MAG: acyltransferase [Syntrophomonas sp.]